MPFRTLLRPIISSALLVPALLAVQAAAQTVTPQIKNIVLVHGAWADGSSWSKVIPLLEAKGLHVVSVQNPLASLADDVAATKRMIDVQDGPVLLVGHSYGGVVITEAGNNPKVTGSFMWPPLLPMQENLPGAWGSPTDQHLEAGN
jgi:Alpha/beta hydrolase family